MDDWFDSVPRRPPEAVSLRVRVPKNWIPGILVAVKQILGRHVIPEYLGPNIRCHAVSERKSSFFKLKFCRAKQ